MSPHAKHTPVLSLNDLWEAMPPDVQRKTSLHDLKRICDNLARSGMSAHGGFSDEYPPTCWMEKPKPPVCMCCNGHGEIGGLLPNGGGYDSEPCPDCNHAKHTMKTNFTPAPWEAVRDHPDKRTAEGMISIYPVSRSMFGSKDSTLSIADMYNCETEEQVANAHLIAASPALFEALKEALPIVVASAQRLHEEADREDNRMESAKIELRAQMADVIAKKIRAALASAQPEAPTE